MDLTKTTITALRTSLLLATVVLLSACGDGATSDDSAVINKGFTGEARGLLPNLARSNAAFEGTHHSGSDSCASCHSDPSMTINTPIPGVTRDVSIGTAWETSVMANATRDPYWHAVVASELHNFPMLEDTINDKCTVCHAPMANDYAKKEGVDMRLFSKGSELTGDFQQGLYSMNEEDELFNHAMDGVSCSL
ncbi:MAG: putative membrane protein, partial [Pseudomonadales bacterium]